MEVLIQLARQKLGGTFILCTGTVMSVNEFIEIACAEIGVPVSKAFKVEESTRLTIQNVTVRGDNTRILRQLGYEDGYFLSHKNLVSKLVDDWREVLNFE
jgi:nucleoside-diphosphate-sugar epimerase